MGDYQGFKALCQTPRGQLHGRMPTLLPQEKLTSTGLQTGVSSSVSICLRPPIKHPPPA